jgi:hypothetical protein
MPPASAKRASRTSSKWHHPKLHSPPESPTRESLIQRNIPGTNPRQDPHHQKPREVTVEPAHKALLPPSGEADRHEPITPTGKHPGRSMVQSLYGFCSIALQHLRHASTMSFKLSCILFFKLSCILPSIGYVDQKNLSQLHRGFISCDMMECLYSDLSVTIQTLKEELGPSCQAAFIGVSVHPSESQQEVSDRLRVMGRSVEDDFRCPKSGYSLTCGCMRVDAMSSTGPVTGGSVEFDGSSHFLTCRLPVAGTSVMKRGHLELLGPA